MTQLDNRSSKDLEDGLEKGEFGPRKEAFAKEILRRREEARRGPRFVWLSSLLAALAVGMAAFRKIWRKPE